MRGQMKKTARIWMLAAALFVAGCNTATLTAASLIDFNPLDFFGTPVNMREKNYAMADYMIDRAKHYMRPNSKIKAMPLQDVQEPRLMTPLGKQVPEQIGERLIELGYSVDLSEVSSDVNPNYAPSPQPVTYTPDFILGGSYVRKGSNLDLRVSIKDAATGFERASFETVLERVGDIRKGTTQKPTIYRVPSAQ